jgi:hypothetical protein
MSVEQEIAENRAWINSVILASKLASELGESTQITNANQTVNIQEGTVDAKFVKIPIIRGSLGSYNPLTNTPTLIDGTGVAGDNYFLTETGTINLGSGNISFLEEDYVRYNGSKWVKTTKSQISDILNLRSELDALALLNLKVVVNGNSFNLVKFPGNALSTLQEDDFIVNGLWDSSEFWSRAQYLGTDKDIKANWYVLKMDNI